MANRVANQVEYNLPQKVLIALNGQAALVTEKAKRDSGLLGDGSHKFHAAAHACCQVHRSQMRVAAAMNAQHIIDSAGEQSNAGTQM